MKPYTTSISIETLRSSWENLLQLFIVDPRISQKIFFELVTAYSSTGRFYHTLKHIQQILETIEQMQSLAKNFPAIQLAAWFHDVIYNSKSQDNEERSAEYAATALSQLKIPITTVESVQNFILNTKNHQAPPSDIDSQILLDADLAILGSPELEYKAYSQAIRQEYSWVNEQSYIVGRKHFLSNFLQRKKIYLTKQMFLSLEANARRNMQNEILDLSSGI
jgi:predicted metal-dependent HD superfamily phosphohydrolase